MPRCWAAIPSVASSRIAAASLGAIGALLSINGANPWWSLAVFFLCIYIIHGIFVFGDDVNAQRA